MITDRLIHTATVYTEDPTTGMATVVARANLPCKLVHVSTDGAGTDRAELLASRRLLWPPDYEMPPNAQIDAVGNRWNIVAGTIATYEDFAGVARYRAADVVRAD